MKINRNGNWRTYWGAGSLPVNAIAFGVITTEDYETGALIKLPHGYMLGNAGTVRALDQHQINQWLQTPEAKYIQSVANWLSVSQVGERCNITRQNVLRACDAGKFLPDEAVKTSLGWLIRPEAADRLWERRAVAK